MKQAFTRATLILVFLSMVFTSSVQAQSEKNAVASKLKKPIADSSVTVSDDGNGNVMVSVDGSMLFAPGSALVDAKAMKVLKPLCELFYKADENFSIMIKTDDGSNRLTPARYVDNTALSQARANTVMRILTRAAMEKHQKESVRKPKPVQEVAPTPDLEQQPVETAKPDSTKVILVLVDSL